MVVHVGLQNKTWLGLSLPFDLGIIGGAGNKVYISLDAPLGLRTGPGTIAAAIPSAVILKGFTFFAQTAVYDTATAPAVARARNSCLQKKLRGP